MMPINRTVFCHFCMHYQQNVSTDNFDITCSHVNRRHAVLGQNQSNTTSVHNSKNANNIGCRSLMTFARTEFYVDMS